MADGSPASDIVDSSGLIVCVSAPPLIGAFPVNRILYSAIAAFVCLVIGVTIAGEQSCDCAAEPVGCHGAASSCHGRRTAAERRADRLSARAAAAEARAEARASRGCHGATASCHGATSCHGAPAPAPTCDAEGCHK